MSKLKITIIWLVITAVILGNFWFYIHSLAPKEIIKIVPSDTETMQKSNTSTKTTVTQTSTSSISQTSSSVSSLSNLPGDAQVSSETSSGGESITRRKNIPKTITTVTSDTSNTNTPTVSIDSEGPKTNDTANYATLEKILVDKSWNGSRSSYAHYWGNENVSFEWDTLKILYPKGSNAPSNTPRGGAGFVYTFPKSYNRLALSYTIRFEDGFDFVKGGKLPGLCGGNCSRGESMPTASGFSLRFVWKKNGYLDTMSFFPNTLKAGNYSWEKMFKFEPGKEYLLTQQITLNDVGSSNGVITILVDGKPVYAKNDVTIRTASDVQISSFLFSTFFWGKDDTYSATKDMHIYFWKFKISDTF